MKCSVYLSDPYTAGLHKYEGENLHNFLYFISIDPSSLVW